MVVMPSSGQAHVNVGITSVSCPFVPELQEASADVGKPVTGHEEAQPLGLVDVHELNVRAVNCSATATPLPPPVDVVRKLPVEVLHVAVGFQAPPLVVATNLLVPVRLIDMSVPTG
jgi:hypothetical protein